MTSARPYNLERSTSVTEQTYALHRFLKGALLRNRNRGSIEMACLFDLASRDRGAVPDLFARARFLCVTTPFVAPESSSQSVVQQLFSKNSAPQLFDCDRRFRRSITDLRV